MCQQVEYVRKTVVRHSEDYANRQLIHRRPDLEIAPDFVVVSQEETAAYNLDRLRMLRTYRAELDWVQASWCRQALEYGASFAQVAETTGIPEAELHRRAQAEEWCLPATAEAGEVQ